MARIPQDFIDNLLERTDIVALIDARLSLKKAGREYQARCPFHDERTPSFTVSPTKQFYHCFGCGAHGSAISFLMEYDRLDFVDAVELLARQFGLELPGDGRDQGASRKLTPLYAAMNAAERVYRRALRNAPDAVDYLKSRGINGHTAKQYGLGFAPAGWRNLDDHLPDTRSAVEAGLLIRRDNGGHYDRFRNRIMFPIRDMRGRIIAFGGRTLGDDKAKYLNSPETPLFHKSRHMYGLYEARQALRELPRLLVVEGYMDVITLAQHGFANTVATLGTATTPEHLRLLFRYTNEVMFCFDGDAAGRRAADKAMQECLPVMRGARRIRFLFLPQNEDPDSLVRSPDGHNLLQSAIDDARPLSALLLDHITDGSNAQTPEQRTQARERARPLVAALPPDTFRTEILKELGRLIGDTLEHLAADLGQPRTRNGAATTASAARPDRNAQPHAIRVTAASTALQLLLHNPALAADADEAAALRESTEPGADLVADAIEFFRHHPNAPMARWLERQRENAAFNRLQDIAATPPPGTDPAQHQRAFADSVQKLQLSGQRERLLERYNGLLETQSRRQLNAEEADELKHILTALKAR